MKLSPIKISLLPRYVWEQFCDYFQEIFVFCSFLFIGFLFVVAATLDGHRQYKLRTEFPTGSTVYLRGLDVKGVVSNTGEETSTILVKDNEGNLQSITVSTELLSKTP